MDKSLLITLEFPPQKGGIANYLANLYSRLPSDKVFVLAPKTKGSQEYDATCAYKIMRGNLLTSYIWPHWLMLYFRVKTLVKKHKITMLHISHVLPVGYIAYRLNQTLKLRYAVFCHGLDILKAQATPQKKQRLIKILNKASGIVVNSEYTRGLISGLGVPDSKVLVVYPCPAFVPNRETIETYDVVAKYGLSEKRVLLSVARLVERKGIDKVLECLPRLYEKFKDIIYVIVGDGPDINRLAKIVDDLKIHNLVRFAGSVSDQDMSKFYSIAEVFALPSRQIGPDVEGFGMVYLEANLFGLPVVGGRSGGVPEAVIDRQTGLLVNPNDTNDIYQAINDLMTDREWAKTLGENGRVRAENDFQWRKETEKLRLFLSGHTYG
ncbi:MAG: glycosyltransferase family 4 protein [Patescibacteria group bacterium]|nr:glycosyltransferase family 4 protein [Patescibacteria group bacterium]